MTAVLKAVENFRLRSVTMKDREVRLDKTLNKHLPLRAAPGNSIRAEQDVVSSMQFAAGATSDATNVPTYRIAID